jgi:TatD DNase family protein
LKLFDSHAHLTDGSFASDLDDVLSRAAGQGVESVATIASNLQDARAAIVLAAGAGQPRVRATAGIHPHEAERWNPEAAVELEELSRDAAVVAIGETGLDFYYDNAPREQQLRSFRSQVELAERVGLPVVVHSRSADAETAAVVRGCAGRLIGVLHCFSGGEELLRAGLESGWYVSFSGIVTFKNFRDEHLVRAVPDDRLLIETDSPYLAPVPRRGKRNEPCFVQHVAERVADIRGADPERIAELTYDNALRFYGRFNSR